MPLLGLGKPNIEKMKAKHDVDGLVKALSYKNDSSVRSNAAKALGEIGETPSFEEQHVGKQKNVNSIDALKNQLLVEQDLLVKKDCEEAILKIEHASDKKTELNKIQDKTSNVDVGTLFLRIEEERLQKIEEEKQRKNFVEEPKKDSIEELRAMNAVYQTKNSEVLSSHLAGHLGTSDSVEVKNKRPFGFGKHFQNSTKCKICGKKVLGTSEFYSKCEKAGMSVNRSTGEVESGGGILSSYGVLEDFMSKIEERKKEQQQLEKTYRHLSIQRGMKCSECSTIYCVECLLKHREILRNWRNGCLSLGCPGQLETTP